MKIALSASTSLSSYATRSVPTEHIELPPDLQPLFTCARHILDTQRSCPAAGCANFFTVRHGVCSVGLYQFYGQHPYIGGAIFCSTKCLLQEIASHGGDGFRREFRDETKTLH